MPSRKSLVSLISAAASAWRGASEIHASTPEGDPCSRCCHQTHLLPIRDARPIGANWIAETEGTPRPAGLTDQLSTGYRAECTEESGPGVCRGMVDRAGSVQAIRFGATVHLGSKELNSTGVVEDRLHPLREEAIRGRPPVQQQGQPVQPARQPVQSVQAAEAGREWERWLRQERALTKGRSRAVLPIPSFVNEVRVERFWMVSLEAISESIAAQASLEVGKSPLEAGEALFERVDPCR